MKKLRVVATVVVHFYYYAHKKSPQSLLRKKIVNFFLFNYEPERIDHGDLKGSNFEDDSQPEMEIWFNFLKQHSLLTCSNGPVAYLFEPHSG